MTDFRLAEPAADPGTGVRDPALAAAMRERHVERFQALWTRFQRFMEIAEQFERRREQSALHTAYRHKTRHR